MQSNATASSNGGITEETDYVSSFQICRLNILEIKKKLKKEK